MEMIQKVMAKFNFEMLQENLGNILILEFLTSHHKFNIGTANIAAYKNNTITFKISNLYMVIRKIYKTLKILFLTS